jgi:hypothetical protein
VSHGCNAFWDNNYAARNAFWDNNYAARNGDVHNNCDEHNAFDDPDPGGLKPL